MDSLKKVIAIQLPFLVSYALFLMVSTFFLASYSKAAIHLYLNAFHSPFFDVFFTYATTLGEGYVIGSSVVMLLFIKYRYALLLLASSVLTSILVQAAKHFIFNDILRPKAHFDGIAELYFVPGVEVHSFFSFPSGHTAAGFCFLFCLSLIVQRKFYSFLFAILAIAIGYSRIYLSQHFLVDVYVGSIVGTLCTSICFYLFGRYNQPWLENSLIRR